MNGKEIIIKGKEYLKYYIADYGEVVNICYKEGEIQFGDSGNYFLKKEVFDLNYNEEENTIDPNNLTFPEATIEEINANIQIMREQAYRDRSDSLYMAYQKYLALGETEKAAESKTQWLTEIEKINNEFPYKS